MDVLTSETCWALNSEIKEQVTSSWSLFIQVFKWFDLPVSTGGMGKRQNILWWAHYRQLVSPLTCRFKRHHHSRFSSFHISPEDGGRSNFWKIVRVFSPSQLTTSKFSGMTRVNTAPLILCFAQNRLGAYSTYQYGGGKLKLRWPCIVINSYNKTN